MFLSVGSARDTSWPCDELLSSRLSMSILQYILLLAASVKFCLGEVLPADADPTAGEQLWRDQRAAMAARIAPAESGPLGLLCPGIFCLVITCKGCKLLCMGL